MRIRFRTRKGTRKQKPGRAARGPLDAVLVDMRHVAPGVFGTVQSVGVGRIGMQPRLEPGTLIRRQVAVRKPDQPAGGRLVQTVIVVGAVVGQCMLARKRDLAFWDMTYGRAKSSKLFFE